MTIKPLQLNVLTPTETIHEAHNIKYVQVSLAGGYPIGIYPGHAPLLAETVAGSLHYADDSGEHTLNLAAGVLQVDGNVVRILTGRQTLDTAGNEATQDLTDLQAPTERPRFDRLAHEMLATLHTQMQETQVDDDG